MMFEQLPATGYFAKEEALPLLRRELRGVVAEHGRLILAAGPAQTAYWAQNIWLTPMRAAFGSIREAAEKLRSLQRNWCLYSLEHHRRGTLVLEQLPHVSAKPLAFPAAPPAASLGAFVLLDRTTMLASPCCTSALPHGEYTFVEHKQGPPSRAYLKLWEVFTRLQRYPRPGERCLDAGASPGGWTWVLAQLGGKVLAVDRSPLAPGVQSLKQVDFQKGDAFSVLPESSGPFDWVCCDVAAYPEKLYAWVERWLASGRCRNLICTIKFQGKDHYGVISRFAELPRGTLLHLSANKHELTFVSAE